MNKRKLISVILSLCMLLSPITPALAADTASVKDTPSPWAAEKVALAIEAGIVPLHLQGDYQKDITRYEMLELMLQALMSYTGLPLHDMVVKFHSEFIYRNYKDVNTDIVNAAYGLGLLKYNDIYYDEERYLFPDENITRQEVAVILFQTAKLMAKHYYKSVPSFSDDWKANPSAIDAIHFLKSTGISNGTGSNRFQPESFATREQAIIMAYSVMNLKSKNFNELGINSLLYADEDLSIENEYFILKIDEGAIYSKDIEKHIIEGFKAAEEVTGLSLYPPEYKGLKILLNADNKPYNSNDAFQIWLNSGNLIINNDNNAVSFARMACEILIRRNRSLQVPYYHPLITAYAILTEYLVNEKMNILSTPALRYYSDSYLTPEQFENLIRSDIQNVVYQKDIEKWYSTPVSFSYLFLRYVFEKYGMNTVNRFLLEINELNTVSEDSVLNFIKENTSASIQEDIIAWYEKNDGVFLPKIYYSRLLTDNFSHESYPIVINSNYEYFPRLFLTPNHIYFVPLCFKLIDEPTIINIGDTMKLIEYLGYNPDNFILTQGNSGLLKVRAFDKSGNLIDSHMYTGQISLSKNGNRAAYLEVTGSGLCELNILYNKPY